MCCYVVANENIMLWSCSQVAEEDTKGHIHENKNIYLKERRSSGIIIYIETIVNKDIQSEIIWKGQNHVAEAIWQIRDFVLE
jgi:hypothetical protein